MYVCVRVYIYIYIIAGLSWTVQLCWYTVYFTKNHERHNFEHHNFDKH